MSIIVSFETPEHQNKTEGMNNIGRCKYLVLNNLLLIAIVYIFQLAWENKKANIIEVAK
jgi:hypothetical protein